MLGLPRTELSVCGEGVVRMGWDPWAVTVLCTPGHRGQMGKLRSRRAKTSQRVKRLQPSLWLLLLISRAWGCVSGKPATSCWWQRSPAGKSSWELCFYQAPGVQ